MAKQKRWQSTPWQSDEEFDLLLQQSLSAIQPPADFSDRVMAAIRQEAAPAAAEIIPLAEPKRKRRFCTAFWPALGTIAASLVLFWAALGPLGTGTPDDNSGALKLQTAMQSDVRIAAIEPLAKIPQNGTAQPSEVTETSPATQPDKATEPVNATQPNDTAQSSGADQSGDATQPTQTSEPTQPNETAQEPIIDEPGAGELILPRAAFGTEAQGTLAVRLLAEVENSQIYTPTINRRGSVATFYTADEENVYSWRVNLSTADSPEVSVVTSRSSIDDIGSMLSKTTEPCDATTLVTSPDSTIIAQNSPDGLWISLAEGEVYSLANEAGGSLLAWSPDSSKLLFTNSQGQLFIGYPLEKRIYQITDMSVEDVCWSTDNQTIIFLTTNNGQSALYIAELI